MLDLFHFPSETNRNVQKFFFNGDSWTLWEKPRGVSMLHVFMIGGGGGGGGGFTGASGTIRGGGGGGASSAITRLIVPAILLPDRLFVQVGSGGAGGAIAGNGSLGQPSFISVAPDTTNTFLVLGSGGTADFGDAGTAAAGGSGGAVTAAFTTGRYTTLGNFFSTAGTAGTNGGTGGGTSVSPSTAIMLSGGAGGGGSTAANGNGNGGDINATGFLVADIAGGNGTVPPGKPGFFSPRPFFSTGGSGGAGHGSATGGDGGPAGGYGCGGGGGGGGTVSGGAGGKGSDGFVLIVGW